MQIVAPADLARLIFNGAQHAAAVHGVVGARPAVRTVLRLEEVNAVKVASVKADKNGKYRLRLKPGKYSVFIKEKGKLYANRFDDGGINPIEVKKGRFSKMDIVIDYEAAY